LPCASLTQVADEIWQLCRDVIGGADDPEGLKTEHINFLIDVVDSNGDGTLGRSEFVERYAREDAVIQAGLRNHWWDLMQIFHKENKKGVNAKPPGLRRALGCPHASAACPPFLPDSASNKQSTHYLVRSSMKLCSRD